MIDPIRKEPSSRVKKNHHSELILGDPNKGMVTRKRYVNHVKYVYFVSLCETKNVKEALLDKFWIKVMHEELEQCSCNIVWTLVPRPENTNVIGTKWIFKNEFDKFGNIVRNKARLVLQGYTQVEGINFDETFAPVTRLESVRLFLAFACHVGFKLLQMDVKSAFLNGILHKEAYVEQPKGFKDPHFPNLVFKLNKALYGLKQALRAWYKKLTNFLIKKRL